ncbi:MAG: FtsQ-type POTRA domain-containing protein [Candidatus Omnitrophica bacterium]|jgi:hypothetical protein|nr:FtsQ-type POTRA domain-containing protein [Candidatus Omnitrophota bacterium]
MRKFARVKAKKQHHFLSVKQVKETVHNNRLGIFMFAVITAAGVLLGMGMHNFIFASEYFNVTEIEVVDRNPDKIDYPLGRINKTSVNIFKINPAAVAKKIEQDYSDIQTAIVQRVLPNKLMIEVVRRHPVVQIAVTGPGAGEPHYFTVNQETYVLNDLGAQPRRGLPVVSGAGVDRGRIEIGRCYPKTNLAYALAFMKEFNSNMFLKPYAVTKIDVALPRSMSVFINDTLEVKIGDRNWKERLENLAGILDNKDIDFSKGYYVDLRFKDLVFGKK